MTINTEAVEAAEILLRRLRTGEMSGFVAVMSNVDEDTTATMMAGTIVTPPAICLLEVLRIKLMNAWLEKHALLDTHETKLGVVDPDE